MTLEEYQRLIWRTAKGFYETGDTDKVRLVAAMGLAGEAGEVLELFKKRFEGKTETVDRARLVEELGDVLWYLAMVADLHGITLEEAACGNLVKLRERHSGSGLDGDEWEGG